MTYLLVVTQDYEYLGVRHALRYHLQSGAEDCFTRKTSKEPFKSEQPTLPPISEIRDNQYQ